jgi:uncharacterized caspase-like protein
MRSTRAARIALVTIGAGLLAGPAPSPAQAPARPQRGLGDKYALLVGVRQYDPAEFHRLPYSESDVEELAQVLKESGYRPENVVLMTQKIGAENTRFLPLAEHIRKECQRLLRGRTRADSVLVALAGHGVHLDGKDYFCPADARLGEKNTLVSLTELYADLEKCGAGFRLLLVDACRNDPLANASRARLEVDLDSLTKTPQQAPPGGVAALFSCSPGERAYEHDDLKHGVFFYFVIEG